MATRTTVPHQEFFVALYETRYEPLQSALEPAAKQWFKFCAEPFRPQVPSSTCITGISATHVLTMFLHFRANGHLDSHKSRRCCARLSRTSANSLRVSPATSGWCPWAIMSVRACIHRYVSQYQPWPNAVCRRRGATFFSRGHSAHVFGHRERLAVPAAMFGRPAVMRAAELVLTFSNVLPRPRLLYTLK